MGNMMNCGGCNKPCTLPNGVTSCVNSVCQLVSCNQGFADCNNVGADGCEVNLQNDAKNCGACNKACAMGQACVMGACTNACLNNIVDDGNVLCVPAGMSYTIAGDKCYA